MKKPSDGRVLLYYHYMHLDDVQREVKWQQETCTMLGLLGRIRVGAEGLNGTVGGSVESCDAYESKMQRHIAELWRARHTGDDEEGESTASSPLVQFKQASGGAEHFNSLLVKACSEIVTMGVSPREAQTHLH